MQIRLTGLLLREVKIPFRFSFRHARAKRGEAHSLILEVRTNTGHRGFGEVAPRAYLTGESVHTAWDDIANRWWPAAKSLVFTGEQPPFSVLRPLYLQADGERKTASYAGMDIAVVDAWGRATQQAIGSLHSQSGASAAVALTAPIGLSGAAVACATAAALRGLGFREFKVKVGARNDIERVRAVRRATGSCDLRVDANGAWTVQEAIAAARSLARLGVSSIEQPLPAGDPAGLAEVQRGGGLPVMADESLCTLTDARALLAVQGALLWNLRLAKIGGFSGMIEMLRLAEENGIGTQLGVLVGETSLLGAAARACVHWANFRHVEFGFPGMLLRGDPFRGGPDGYRGTGAGDRQPGLGVVPSERRLDRITVKRAALQ